MVTAGLPLVPSRGPACTEVAFFHVECTNRKQCLPFKTVNILLKRLFGMGCVLCLIQTLIEFLLREQYVRNSGQSVRINAVE